ncbi:replication protein [Moraxella bovis]|uniref:replication protein n=1 Tax=Moraxella bovis TaxID=476 RepID=UPI002227FBB6|nr:replication protein [Moraxella bovis]UZA25333.1 replication protein [Moraxella bovis]UZA25707.1 replication protein [Moraxella bovis]UZA28800.1 replication protein [Moraxella bovis]UZA29176.1 replication protein [Moraxella bovis]
MPNAFVDDVLNQLSGNACKIYLLIVRKTRGWHKEADKISYSQIQKYTGINSRTTISKALDELLDLGLIIMQNGNEKSSNEYRLNDGFASPKNGLDKNCTSPKNEPASPKNGLEPSPKNGHTEIHIFKNTNQKYNEYDTHTHESQTFENSQTAKPNKSTGKSPSAKKFITADKLVSLGVDEQVANDYLATRKTKLTQTALNGIIKQSTLANITLAQALEFTCEMGWQSFKAEWYLNSQKSFNQPQNNQPISQHEQLKQMAQNWDMNHNQNGGNSWN